LTAIKPAGHTKKTLILLNTAWSRLRAMNRCDALLPGNP
jgi:hypothetical protein